MKELYISPVLNLLCLAPEEKLMSSDVDDEIDFDTMLQGNGGGVSANPDVDIDIPLLP